MAEACAARRGNLSRAEKQSRPRFRGQIQEPRQLVNLGGVERGPFNRQPSHRGRGIGAQLEAHANRGAARGRLRLGRGPHMLDGFCGIRQSGFDRGAVRARRDAVELRASQRRMHVARQQLAQSLELKYRFGVHMRFRSPRGCPP